MPVRWPHEADFTVPPIEDYAGRLLPQLAIMNLLRPLAEAPQPWGSRARKRFDELVFRLLNGQDIPLLSKLEFTEAVRKIGYQAPASVLVQRGERDHGTKLAAIKALDLTSPRRLCKPLFSSRGRGLWIAPTPEQALAFALGQRCPYLVQNLLPPVLGEYRYILHRTVDDVRMRTGAPPSLRSVFSKYGPELTGDGESSVLQLLARHRSVRPRDRAKLAMAIRENRVPKRGESVPLVNAGNVRNSYARLVPAGEELAEIDRMMEEFLQQLEKYLGYQLITACFDVGRTSEGLVFYEIQPAFHEWYPPGSLPPQVRRALHRRLNQSILIAGCVAEDQRK